MAHVGLHHVQTKVRDHLVQLLRAFFVGGNLGLQVGQVLLRVSGGIGSAGEQRQHLGFTQHAVLDQQKVVDQHALLLDTGGKRRHRAGRDAAHIGMVAARADVKSRRPRRFRRVQVDRRDHRDVR